MTLTRMKDWLGQRTTMQHAWFLAVLAQALFLFNLKHPNKLMFDEFYYVPAARATFGAFERINGEHPLFAKWLIGLSMSLFGNTPWGWRVLSTVAGTATILAVFSIAQGMFQNRRAATAAALFALFNQMVFIQSRIAMLDGYMGAFLMVGMACALWAKSSTQYPRSLLVASGICLGLAIGCKWTAMPYLALLGGAVALVKRKDAASFGEARWFEPSLWIGVPATLVYFATFAPALFYEKNPVPLDGLLSYQAHMYRSHVKAVGTHPYMSPWWKWPLIQRPIWYFYERVDGALRGVLMIGNPAVMWGGLVAVVVCLAMGVKNRQAALLWAAGLYCFSLGEFIVIPKKICYYYYYYLPALFLSFALAGTFITSEPGNY